MVALTLILSISLLTRWMIVEKQFPAIRVSTGLTLVAFAVLSIFNVAHRELLEVAALGGTFVGMTDPSRLPRKSLVFASCLFALAYSFILPMNKGLGGAIGLAAFMSASTSYVLRDKVLKRK